MQEEVNQKTVALSIKTAKLTGKVLAAALGKVVRALQKHHRKALTPQGRLIGFEEQQVMAGAHFMESVVHMELLCDPVKILWGSHIGHSAFAAIVVPLWRQKRYALCGSPKGF